MTDGRRCSSHHPVEDLLQDLLSDQLVDLERRKERRSCAGGQPESVAMHQSDLEVSERWLLVAQTEKWGTKAVPIVMGTQNSEIQVE